MKLGGKKGDGCAHLKVDIEVVESLLKPEKQEVSPKYILKHSTRRDSNMFQLFDTQEKPNHFWGKQKTMAGEPREILCTARRWAKRVA